MRVNIDRLRFWMLALAGLLVVGVLAFFGYARWQIHRMGRDLPGKLGITIQQSTEGFTFSKSDRGHTLFTLHAAKTVQYKSGGRAELHDVSITLYDPAGSPADRIYGNDFEYDPANGVVRANGAVEIDLQGPAAAAPPPAGGESDRNVVHVKTAGLTFNQKTGMASTSQPIEFHIAEAAGSATGASFDSRSGVLILDSDVSLDSSLEGSPLAVRARHAQFDRASRHVYLLTATTDYRYSHSSSDEATVYFRPDGSALYAEARGHVVMSTGEQRITSQRANANLDAKSMPEQVILEGGVLYVAREEARQIHGTASAGTLFLGPQSSIRHVQLRDAVSIVDQEKDVEMAAHPQESGGRPAKPRGTTTREVEASRVDVDFAQAPDHRSIAQNILATGGAQLKVHTLYASSPPDETEVQGDEIFATLRDGVALSSLRGTGHTKLVELSPNGVRRTGTADHLLMTFAPPSRSKATERKARSSEPQQAAQLESVEQRGHVLLVEQVPARQGAASDTAVASAAQAPLETTATAERAVYEAATQRVRLFGNPRLRDADGELTASTITFDRGTGNAEAMGGVEATYRASTEKAGGEPGGQPAVGLGGEEPVHVIADHAHLDHGKDLSTFYGRPQEGARLWQGADSISAPVIELARAQRTLSAYGANGPAARTSASQDVVAVLSSVAAAAGTKSGPRGKPEQGSVMRVSSQTLLYSDVEAKAVFRGGVVARNSSGTMHSSQMDVYFTPDKGVAMAGIPGAVRKSPGAGGKVERIVAQGDVELDQPGRRATGSDLVYTALDGRFVLTGSRSTPPLLVDQVHGTVTGESLIFNDRDGSVMVRGGQSRAVTETHVGSNNRK